MRLAAMPEWSKGVIGLLMLPFLLAGVAVYLPFYLLWALGRYVWGGIFHD